MGKKVETLKRGHVGPAIGGPADGKTLRAKASRLSIPVLLERDLSGFGQAIYTWSDVRRVWVYDA